MQKEGNTTIDEKPATLGLHTVRSSSWASTTATPCTRHVRLSTRSYSDANVGLSWWHAATTCRQLFWNAAAARANNELYTQCHTPCSHPLVPRHLSPMQLQLSSMTLLPGSRFLTSTRNWHSLHVGSACQAVWNHILWKGVLHGINFTPRSNYPITQPVKRQGLASYTCLIT